MQLAPLLGKNISLFYPICGTGGCLRGVTGLSFPGLFLPQSPFLPARHGCVENNMCLFPLGGRHFQGTLLPDFCSHLEEKQEGKVRTIDQKRQLCPHRRNLKGQLVPPALPPGLTVFYWPTLTFNLSLISQASRFLLNNDLSSQHIKLF